MPKDWTTCPLSTTSLIHTYDDILADIDHTAGKVTGVGGTKCGIGKTLSCTSGGNEVFQNGKAFTEVCFDGDLDGLTGGVSHKATHTGKLTDLVHGTTSAGVCHHVDRIVGIKAVLKCGGNILGGLFPLGDDKAVTLVIGDEATLELTLDLDDLLLGLVYEGLLCLGDGHVGDGDCDSALCRVLVAHCLDAVENFCGNGEAVLLDAAVNDVAQLLLADLEADLVVKHGLGIGAVNISQILRDVLVEDDAADGALDNFGLLDTVDSLCNSYEDGGVQADITLTVCHDRLIGVTVAKQGLIGGSGLALGLGLLLCGNEFVAVDYLTLHVIGVARLVDADILCALLCLADALHGKVVRAEDHILSRHGYGVAILWTQEVICRKHEYSRLGLCLCRQRYMDSHLVAVEVGVICGTYQRVQLKSTTLN